MTENVWEPQISRRLSKLLQRLTAALHLGRCIATPSPAWFERRREGHRSTQEVFLQVAGVYAAFSV